VTMETGGESAWQSRLVF